MNKLDSYNGEILIVDDEPANLELLFGMLSAQHYDVRVANGADLALTVVQSSLPDLILLDINMPDMNGYEVCRRLKADPNTRDVPVIFISANDYTEDKIEAFRAGGVDYVTKPFQVEEVITRIESQLKISRLSQQLEMQMLRYQLNPHFLFNALISIRNIVSDNREAVEVIGKFSDYLRYLLTSRNRMELAVGEELDAARNYLTIEKIRFENKLIVRIDIDSGIEDILMPSFLLQPLLENAVKYGMKTSQLPLELELSAKLIDKSLCFRVSNSGHWINHEDEEDIPHGTSLGVGLQNIRQRLKQKYPFSHSFTIDEGNERVDVKIVIPVS
jgi:DNA-binding response OmpR family regulator